MHHKGYYQCRLASGITRVRFPYAPLMPSTLEAALEYVERGWSVFPLHDKRRPCIQWKQYQTERPTADQVRAWWEEYPDAYIGVALGSVSGVIRVDAEGGGAEKLASFGGLPETAAFKSPGGQGWLLAHVEGFTTDVVWTGEGEHNELRIQSKGAYTCLPPSPGYLWLNDLLPSSAPMWMLDYYSGKVLKELERELRPTLRLPDRTEVLEALAFIPSDEYDRWVQVGMALRNAGDEYLTVWDTWSKGSEKYKDGECERKWQSFIPGGLSTRSILYWAETRGYRPFDRHEPLTELGNARILARMGEGKILHNEKWGWLAWDGSRWAMDNAEKVVVELQKGVLEYRLNRAMESLGRCLKGDNNTADFERRKKSKLATITAIRRHETERAIAGSRSLASSEPSISCKHTQFNVDPWMLNCPNGTLNLRNGELTECNPANFIMQLCPTTYDESAQSPRWLQFLDEVFCDPKLVSWVQRLFGYCLTGCISEHILPIFHGVGRNGKSTLIKTAMAVLGSDYSGTTPSGFLTMSRNEGHPTKLVTLYGKRFVADLETGDGAKLNEELVKRVTGGDEIQARRMHENFWWFKPTHKLCLATNYEPRIKGMDIAIWSRIKLIPFLQVFEGERQDRNLDATLQREASGILNWMVQGCFKWQVEGLGDVQAVTDATDAYRGTQDTVTTFHSERIELCSGSKVKKVDVYSVYKGWCLGNSVDAVSKKTFEIGLAALGVQSSIDNKHYIEVKL